MVLQENNGQDAVNCKAVFHCCKTSNPCHNGGTCLIPSTNSSKRYRCKCLKGYTGQHCENLIRSCRGYGNGKRIAGSYAVLDANNNPFEVFCDFEGSSNMTWTLIQSYSLENKNIFQSLSKDSPQNQNSGPSWLDYRLSKSQMQFIQGDSSKWRVTCAYAPNNVSYTDYVSGLNAKMDILTFDKSNVCVELEYINIRGQYCTSCTAAMWQGEYFIVHFDSYRASTSNCDFKPTASEPCDTGNGEDNFGFYSCINPKHRCSSSAQATTQTWFGGED